MFGRLDLHSSFSSFVVMLVAGQVLFYTQIPYPCLRMVVLFPFVSDRGFLLGQVSTKLSGSYDILFVLFLCGDQVFY